MYEAMGVGLAAPQVGVLKRIVVIDVGEGPIILINPEILETSGEQTGEEGCLSVPGKCGQVTRPNYVKVRALDEDMNEFEMEGEGLLARAFCHEIDHLDGKMYVDLVEGGYSQCRREEEEYDESHIYGDSGFLCWHIRGACRSRDMRLHLAVTQPDKPKGTWRQDAVYAGEGSGCLPGTFRFISQRRSGSRNVLKN